MSSDDTLSPAMNQIRETLSQSENPQQCLELAAAADAAGDTELSRSCLERAVALDRFCQPALLNLAALALSEDDALSAFSMLEEAARISPLPEDVEPLREQLYTAAREVPELAQYLRLVGRTPVAPAEQSLSIMVVTGGFPPHDASDAAQEPGELVRGLRARGHRVNVLTAGGTDQSDDPSVTGDLRFCATWVSGKAVPIEDAGERQQRVNENIEHVR
jgi:lipopolysaccharide biosynthesis regulator YciM